MTTVLLIAAVLAVWEIVEIWHHSALFSTLRARVECWEGWLGSLLRCPFCLSPWVGLLVVLWLDLGLILDAYCPRPVGLLVDAPVYGLAAARAANLANDLTHRFCRTPRYDTLPPNGEVDADGPPKPQ